ncbi:hypothetical protein [uncultured Phascolarctobacterium sp.]|uniref:hypothetical protein n=1 Tax=uncultured Phascolarctobacterium sp. TaxID=512296 RepID=UPI002613C565|nr:hypothetical protein [uncultured Phascolarctobacterium sp.]
MKKHWKNYLLPFLTIGLTVAAPLAGCYSSKPAALIDYSAQPQNFVLQLELDKSYIIKRNGEEFSLQVKTHTFSDSKVNIIWKKLDEEKSVLRVKKQVPYLIYADGKDFLYMYEKGNGALAYFDLNNPKWITHRDNAYLEFLEEPKDPTKLLVTKYINNIGHCYAEEYYHVGQDGKLYPNNPEPEFHYAAQKFVQKPVTLLQNITTEVFPNADAHMSMTETLPKGLQLKRFRTRHSDPGAVDLLLPDGRVARFYERYLFSEPKAYLEINGLSGHALFNGVL